MALCQEVIFKLEVHWHQFMKRFSNYIKMQLCHQPVVRQTCVQPIKWSHFELINLITYDLCKMYNHASDFILFQGQWVLLHNAQNAPHLLLALESIIEELSSGITPDPQFRVWISCQAVAEVLPVRLLQNSVRTILDSPKVSTCLLGGYLTWTE